MKARIKVYVQNSTVIVLAQVKLGFFWTNIAEYSVGYSRTEEWCIQQAKERIQRFKDAGFDENGVIEVDV